MRPNFETIKAELADIAKATFNCSVESASQLKRAKQKALLNQMLPSKVYMQNACVL